MAELAKAGLPLGEGLRAVAGEFYGDGRTSRALLTVADRLDAGATLVEAMETVGRRLPLCLRGVMLAGLRSGNLAEALEEYVELRRRLQEIRHHLWMSLAYPLFLLCVLALLAAMMACIVVPDFQQLFDEWTGWGMELPALTRMVLAASSSLAWVLGVIIVAIVTITILLAAAAPGVGFLWPLLYKMPALGPMLRWENLGRFSSLMAMLLEHHVPLPDALRLTAAGLHDPHLAAGCRRAAKAVEQGQSLKESMARRRQFPAGMIPLIECGGRTDALPDAFRATAEMFKGRVVAQGSLLEAILPPLALLFIAVFVGTYVIALMMPFISLISNLS